MGISDKEYGEALERQRAYQVELVKLELEKQKEEAKMAGLMSSLGNLIGAGQQQAIQPGAYQNVAAQQALGAYPNSNLTLSTATGTTQATWANTLNTQQPLGIKTLNEQDLQHDAMKAPLSALVDMWTMRWQGEWVSETEFQEDDFWRLALIRLTGANKLEKHHLANQYAAVYRIIE